MLVLSTLHTLLSQTLSAQAPSSSSSSSSPSEGAIKTAALLTPAGELVSAASAPASRPKDQLRLLVGVAADLWQDTNEEDARADSEQLGRVLVLPIGMETVEDLSPSGPDSPSSSSIPPPTKRTPPLMLLALNAKTDVPWEDLLSKGRMLADHLAKPLGRYREQLTAPGSSSSPLSSGRRVSNR